MNVVVTIKMTATEFDTMWKALEGFADQQHAILADKDSSIGSRSDARASEAQTRDLLAKLSR